MSGSRRVPGLACSFIVVLAATMIAGPGARAAVEEQFPRGLLKTGDRGCTIETRPVSFGEYDTTEGRPVDGRGDVVYTCTGSLFNPIRNIRIELSRGLSGSYDRSMISYGDRLRYNLYLDSTHRTVWGDGSSGTEYYFDSRPPDRSVTVNVYGRIAAEQDVRAGQYADALVVRILF